MRIKTIAVIPHYRHERTIQSTVEDLLQLQLPCIVVDDGSGEQTEVVLAELERKENVTVIRHLDNGGKGAAVKTGLQTAAELGYTHVLQIDADRQHQFSDIPKFLAAAEKAPHTVICGKPIYGEDAPKSRRYGREITNFWIWVNTGSKGIHDGMCGFRLYPLAETLSVIQKEKIGNRMDFDTEILVHLHWAGLPIEWIDTPVRYAEDGVSHFRMVKDNIDISLMHTRLFFLGMKKRLWKK
ncbi:N-glycosyltransferase [Suttonella ornithocola]|uniref:N-glycosyltransferase n=1 Tax=Suttonella ornithocola TaxID=279832 RepID=A0A380MT02_9GAMM|nr:glycosyltransferase family 2 protein [Suttonella ornithocola]SUO95418.1 N-glycosyltransferase [Suttonella ornithocola]